MIAHRHLGKDLLRILFWYPFRWVILALPLTTVWRLGGLLGEVDYAVSGRKRIRRMTDNVSRALGVEPEAAGRTVRENLRNHVRNTLELMKYPQLGGQGLAAHVSYDNLGYLDRALAEQRGVILMTAHFGAKQLLQIALGSRGVRLHQVHYHMKGDELTWVQRRVSQSQRMSIERRLPVVFIPAKGFMRPLFECLKRREVVIVAGDGIGLRRHMDLSYAPFPFLGERMQFPTNAAALAKRTGAALLPVFVVREGHRQRIAFEPALDLQADSRDITLEYVRVLERYVRRYPELWEFWEEFDEDNLLVTPSEGG